MKTIQVPLDDATADRLRLRALDERRALPMQARVMLEKALAESDVAGAKAAARFSPPETTVRPGPDRR